MSVLDLRIEKKYWSDVWSDENDIQFELLNFQ